MVRNNRRNTSMKRIRLTTFVGVFWGFPQMTLFVIILNLSLVYAGLSDPAMKQFLLHLDETMALGKKFILKDLDDTHLFIMAEVVQTLQERVGELMDQNSFPITQK